MIARRHRLGSGGTGRAEHLLRGRCFDVATAIFTVTLVRAVLNAELSASVSASRADVGSTSSSRRIALVCRDYYREGFRRRTRDSAAYHRGTRTAVRVEPVAVPQTAPTASMPRTGRVRGTGLSSASGYQRVCHVGGAHRVEAALTRLAEDLESGEWDRRYGSCVTLTRMTLAIASS